MVPHRETGRYKDIGKLGAIKTVRILYKDYHVIHITVYCGQKEKKKKKKRERKEKTQPKLIPSIYIQLRLASKIQDSAIRSFL